MIVVLLYRSASGPDQELCSRSSPRSRPRLSAATHPFQPHSSLLSASSACRSSGHPPHPSTLFTSTRSASPPHHHTATPRPPHSPSRGRIPHWVVDDRTHHQHCTPAHQQYTYILLVMSKYHSHRVRLYYALVLFITNISLSQQKPPDASHLHTIAGVRARIAPPLSPSSSPSPPPPSRAPLHRCPVNTKVIQRAVGVGTLALPLLLLDTFSNNRNAPLKALLCILYHYNYISSSYYTVSSVRLDIDRTHQTSAHSSIRVNRI